MFNHEDIMKRILLGGLLSCMLIGQVACNEVQLMRTAAETASLVAGLVVGGAVPAYIAHCTDVPNQLLESAQQENSEVIKWGADAIKATHVWSALAIFVGSIVTARVVGLDEHAYILNAAYGAVFASALSAIIGFFI
jgi:hypothetical protein